MNLDDWLIAVQVVVAIAATAALYYGLWRVGRLVQRRLAERTVRGLDADVPGWRVKDPEFAAQLDHLTEEAADR